MSNNGVEQKPSETALYAALRRDIAYREFQNEEFGPDYIAEKFLPAHFRFFLKFNKLRTNIKNRLDAFLPGLYEYMIARTAYFDNLFRDALENRVPQIVLLGAGYDTRAYRFAALNQGTKVIELDAVPTQQRKMECLKSAHIQIPPQVKLAGINFNRESLGDVLGKVGYDEQEKTLFIWEGVTYYLDPESVDASLGFVSHSANPDTAIAFDYTISINNENEDRYYGVREFAATMREHHASEELMFSIPDGEIESFLAQRGLKPVQHLDNKEIEQRFLMQQDGSLIGRMTGHFRFVLAGKHNLEGSR